ncbi:MAG: helix-turn-helix domain-containing protein [Gaiellaceae bacterium]
MSERLVTARDVAEQLGVTPKTVLRWTGRGLLPAIRLPSGALRYRPEDVDAWLHEHETGTDDASRGVSPTRSAIRPGQAYEERRYFDSSPTTLRFAARDEEEPPHAC